MVVIETPNGRYELSDMDARRLFSLAREGFQERKRQGKQLSRVEVFVAERALQDQVFKF